MPFSRSSSRAVQGRRAVAAELERLVAEHLRDRLGNVEDTLAALAADGLPPGVSAEQVFGEGERIPRIRPVMVYLAAQASAQRDADPAAAVEVAYVAELLHAALRVHDAALGRQDGRRRRAARRVLRGASSFVGGSPLVLRALELARHAPAPEILGDALDALRELSESQRPSMAPVMPAAAVEHAAARHGAVFAFSCRAGGHLAGAERPVVTRLGRYGRHVGTAWQLAEDLAAFEGTSEDAWAPLVRQADAGRPVHPVLSASLVDPTLPARWARLGATGDAGLAAEIAHQVRAAGGLGATREVLAGQVWSARLALGPVPASPARDALDRIAATLSLAA